MGRPFSFRGRGSGHRAAQGSNCTDGVQNPLAIYASMRLRNRRIMDFHYRWNWLTMLPEQ